MNSYLIPFKYFKRLDVSLTITARVAAALYMFYSPLWGFVLTTLLDFIDVMFWKHRAGMSWSEYHILDKYLDLFSYGVMLIIGIRYDIFYLLLLLLIYRLVGWFIFIKKNKLVHLILFANFFEFVFLFFLIKNETRWIEITSLSAQGWLVGLLLLKILQEAWLNYLKPRYYMKIGGYPKLLKKLGCVDDIPDIWFDQSKTNT